MFMDGIFPDRVASIRRLNKIKTSLVVMTLFAGVHPCVGSTASLHLTSYSESATDGTDFRLSCTPTQGSQTFISVKWYRNNVNIFDTSSDADASAAILHPLTTSHEYQSVSGRISVSSSLQQHNVTLRTNSQLDQGSVWRCQSGQQFSDNLTIEVKDSIQGTSSPGPESTRDSTTLAIEGQHTGPSSTDDKDMITTNQTTTSTQSASSTSDKGMMTTNPTVSTKSPSSTDDKDIMTTNQTVYANTEFFSITAGATGGVVIVVVIVMIVLLCIRSRREGKCQTNDKTEKDNCKEGGHNEESEREMIVMEDNDLYHGFVRTENQESVEEQQVSDVYAKVNKVRKTHNATEVQITPSIEDLYVKPNKPARGKSEASHKVSSSQNADVDTPD